jgi:hypothetical protein
VLSSHCQSRCKGTAVNSKLAWALTTLYQSFLSYFYPEKKRTRVSTGVKHKRPILADITADEGKSDEDSASEDEGDGLASTLSDDIDPAKHEHDFEVATSIKSQAIEEMERMGVKIGEDEKKYSTTLLSKVSIHSAGCWRCRVSSLF